MLTGIIVLFTVLLALALLVVYRRDAAAFLRGGDARQATVQMQAQLEETADAILAEIDQRISRLEVLLARADAVLAQHDASTPAVAAPAVAPSPTGADTAAKQREIARLRQNGLSDEDIAQLTGVGIGEIQLISRLYKL